MDANNVCRLKLVDLFKTSKEIQNVPVPKPLFVMGLPRTGTTLLYSRMYQLVSYLTHVVLAQDPNARPTYAWEQTEPFPPPEKETFFTDKYLIDVLHLITADELKK